MEPQAIPEDRQRLSEDEVKAVIKLWSERQNEADCPELDTRPSIRDVAVALDLSSDDTCVLLQSVRNQRAEEQRQKEEIQRREAEAEQRRLQDHLRVAREKRRLADAKRQAKAIPYSWNAPASASPAAPGVPVAPVPTLRRPATFTQRDSIAIFAVVCVAAIAAVAIWRISAPQPAVRGTAAAVPIYTPPPAAPPQPPAVFVTPGIAARQQQTIIIQAPSHPNFGYAPNRFLNFGRRCDPLEDARQVMEFNRANMEAQRAAIELHAAETRARSQQMFNDFQSRLRMEAVPPAAGSGAPAPPLVSPQPGQGESP